MEGSLNLILKGKLDFSRPNAGSAFQLEGTVRKAASAQEGQEISGIARGGAGEGGAGARRLKLCTVGYREGGSRKGYQIRE